MSRFPLPSLAPLQYPDFRRLWSGLVISMTGTTMRNAAVLWHVSLLVPAEERAMALAFVGLVRLVPILVCSVAAGVIADAGNRRNILLIVNSFLLVVSSTLAVSTALGAVTAPALYVAAALLAGASAFDNPARNALYPSLVPTTALSDAIVLLGAAFQLAAAMGPALGGLIIGYASVAWVYALDALSFVVILWQLLGLSTSVSNEAQRVRSQVSFSAALDGLRFVFGKPLIRSSMLLDFFATVLASATTLLPIIAQDVLGVGAEGYGILSSAMAAGSLAAALLLTGVVQRAERRGLVLIGSVAVFGFATFVFGVSQWFWLSWGCLFVAGAADLASTVIRQLIRQLETPDELRGRMAGVNLLFFQGGPQLGEFEAGMAAQMFGLRGSVAAGGLMCVLLAVWTAARSSVLRQYRAPEVRSITPH